MVGLRIIFLIGLVVGLVMTSEKVLSRVKRGPEMLGSCKGDGVACSIQDKDCCEEFVCYRAESCSDTTTTCCAIPPPMTPSSA